MKKNLPVALIILILVAIVSAIIWQKSQVSPQPKPKATAPTVKKIDLSTQPEWVQKLDVTAVPGKSPNGLRNVTITIKGMPKGQVQSLDLVMQYQTTNRGAQGALAHVDIKGAQTYSKTIDFGTCSTKSCVTHDGVTAIDLELDFTTSSGDQPAWSKTLDLK